MSTRVTVKGQVTLPKAVRDAAGIRPGDRVTVRARPEGGVIVEQDESQKAPAVEAAKRRIDEALKLLDERGIKFSMTTDEWKDLMRADD
jgi:AbrB family looped-hinge helix DNA binding protein